MNMECPHKPYFTLNAYANVKKYVKIFLCDVELRRSNGYIVIHQLQQLHLDFLERLNCM
jgi:hypothetical protein